MEVVAVAPAGTPHEFVNVGTSPLRQIGIHPVALTATERLE